jgi:signal transduction histidine kinase
MGYHRVGRRIPIRTVKTFAWGVGVVLIAGLIVAELAMDLTSTDRGRLYAVFGVMAIVTFLSAVISVWVAPRLSSLVISVRILAFGAVVVSAMVVAVSAMTMFIEPHDLNLVMVALLMGLGLGGILAVAIAQPLTDDLAAMSSAARRAGEGDLTARTNIERRDELGVAGRAFDEMVSKLEHLEEERRALLTSVGHDLRTPLASMQAAVEAIQDGVAPDPAAYLRGMSHDIDHLRHLVDDLFLLARIDSNLLELSLTQVDLAELADEAVEAVTPAAAKRRVRLSVEAPGRLGVHGDPAALGRVFRNLLANAVRHSPEDGEVRIELADVGLQVEAVVIDQGGGFTHPLQAFVPFTTTDRSRNRDSGGSGLGLAIAKGIIEAHGGTIGIDEGPGGRVKFALPSR